MLIKSAHITDASDILALQKLAYQDEAVIYQDNRIPPLMQTLEEITAESEDKIFLKTVHQEKIIGSVRAYDNHGTCFIGRLVVHPRFQNQGIGTQLMAEIEKHFSHVCRYELFTGSKSKRNLYFYQKLGYSVFRQEVLSEKVLLFFLEKFNN